MITRTYKFANYKCMQVKVIYKTNRHGNNNTAKRYRRRRMNLRCVLSSVKHVIALPLCASPNSNTSAPVSKSHNLITYTQLCTFHKRLLYINRPLCINVCLEKVKVQRLPYIAPQALAVCASQTWPRSKPALTDCSHTPISGQ